MTSQVKLNIKISVLLGNFYKQCFMLSEWRDTDIMPRHNKMSPGIIPSNVSLVNTRKHHEAALRLQLQILLDRTNIHYLVTH